MKKDWTKDLLVRIKDAMQKEMYKVQALARRNARGSMKRAIRGSVVVAGKKVKARLSSSHPLANIMEVSGRSIGGTSTNRQSFLALPVVAGRIYPGTRTRGATVLGPIPGIGFRSSVRQSRMRARPAMLPALLRRKGKLEQAVISAFMDAGVVEVFSSVGKGSGFTKELSMSFGTIGGRKSLDIGVFSKGSGPAVFKRF